MMVESSAGRYVALILTTFLVGWHFGYLMSSIDINYFLTKTRYNKKILIELSGYEITPGKALAPTKTSQSAIKTPKQRAAEIIGEDKIGIWSQDLTEVTTSIVVSRNQLEYEAEHCKDASWCDVSASNGRHCQVCQFGDTSDKCIEGTVMVTLGPEENVPMDQDCGTKNVFQEFRKAFKSNLAYERYPLRTVHLRCMLPEPASHVRASDLMTLKFDYGLEDNSEQVILIGQLPSPPPMEVENQPVVCGRALFSTVLASSIAFHVENNIMQGIPITILYDVGSATVIDRPLLDPYIAEGSLVIVDLRTVLEDLYGIRSQWVVWNTKAFLQSLTRKDCLDRVQRINPSWVGFIDVDEFLTANIFGDMDKKNIEAFEIFMLSPLLSDGRPDEGFCPQNKRSMEAREVAGESYKTGLTKLFVKPTIPYTDVKVHWVSIIAHLTQKREVPHLEVIPPETAFLYHARCLNYNLTNC